MAETPSLSNVERIEAASAEISAELERQHKLIIELFAVLGHKVDAPKRLTLVPPAETEADDA